MRYGIVLCLSLALPLAADVEIGGEPEPATKAPSSRFNDASGTPPPPVALQAGDVPTAYGLTPHETRADVRFYEAGGIVTKLGLGLFDRLYVGGAANVASFIGSGILKTTREDFQLLARLLVLKEEAKVPALALGWDGPAYERGELRGLYLVLSKEFSTALGFWQVHASANTGKVEQFVGDRDLRAAVATSTTLSNLTFFTELDEIRFSAGPGPRWNAGIQAWFDPISLGIEFRDLGVLRTDVQVTRLLKVSWVGRF